MIICKKMMVKKMCFIYMKSSMNFDRGSSRSKNFNDIVTIRDTENCKRTRFRMPMLMNGSHKFSCVSHGTWAERVQIIKEL